MRNVALLCLDTVRKDFFDRYARRIPERADLTYEQCRAASSWTVPSHGSMFTGDLPHEHGVHTYRRQFSALDRSDTFLAGLDHAAVGASANVFAGPEFGFADLFDEFAYVSDSHRFADGLDPAEFTTDADGPLSAAGAFLRAALADDHTLASLANGVAGGLAAASTSAPVPKLIDDGATAINRAARSQVAERSEPVFLFANYMDAHTPLHHVRGYDRSLHSASNSFSTDEYGVWDLMNETERHEEFLETRRELYGASIEYLDRKVDELVDRLLDETDRETTVVVTADHGENLGYPGENGHVRHKSSLSEGLVHVPMYVINAPGDHPTRIDDLVSQLDLGRLLVEIAHGTVPEIGRETVPAEVVGMSAGPEPPADREYWDRMLRAAYRGGEKVVWDSLGEVRRRDLAADPTASPGRSAERVPSWARAPFEEPIDAVKGSITGPKGGATDASPAVERRLEELGYM